ncbi:MAG: HAMP domain-containing histidine kinase [Cycloclasticus sp.]|nr:HAMP domain-containing histidine kinase [Cycloclasticus sp.]
MSTLLPQTTSSASDENLRKLLSLRALNVSGQLVAVLTAIYYLDLALPITPLAFVFMTLIGLSLGTFFLFKRPSKITDTVFFFQLIIDVIALTALLYFTGGATNPFAWFLLVPHSIASTLLSRQYVWLMALITSLAYTLLVFYYRPLIHLDHNMEMGMGGHFAEHITGMWIGFVLSTVLMAYFVAGMADSLRKRNKLLADMQERIFRDERLVALGTLATGAAHELGTPLGTMDVLAHELELEFKQKGDEPAANKLALIQRQVKRCKNVLSSITETATLDKYDAGQSLPVDVYLTNVITQWRISHLEVNLIESVNGEGLAPNITSDMAVTRALINILDNASRVSPQYVSITLNWNGDTICFVIEDNGCGMPAGYLAKLGMDVMPSKAEGLGLGIYITKATIERLGGDVQWENKEDVGVRVTINLPLSIEKS